MPRGITLGELITDLRHETNTSADPALGIQSRDKYAHVLKRAQETLWLEHDWQHLKVTRFVTMAAGQRYYDWPSDLAPDRIDRVEFREETTSNWRPVDRYITTEDLNLHDSDTGVRQDGVKKWDLNEDGAQFEVWPIPESNGTNTGASKSYILRFHGVRNLNPLLNDNDDTCDLDSNLIVLSAAVTLLAATDSKAAEEKAASAGRLLKRLKANSSVRRDRGFSMNQMEEPGPRQRIVQIKAG
jgi:hypothetical protein